MKNDVFAGLPALYRQFLPDFFGREAPEETRATCANCAMCAGKGTEVVAPVDGISRVFRPDTKCCTYYPKLPNYLIGGLLQDTNPALAEGQRRIRAKIAGRVGVTPQWVKPPAKFDLLYVNARDVFGRTDLLRCPYYEPNAGACTVWAYREAVCSTFFCKYVAGADGQKFWMTLKTYLSLVEVQLSRYALFQILPEFVHESTESPATRGTQPLTLEDLEERAPPEAKYRALWRDWAGREEELYKRCYEIVRGVTPEQAQLIVGFDGVASLDLVSRQYGKVAAPKLPERLKLNGAATVTKLPSGEVAVAGYNEFDALALPAEAYELLMEFRGDEPLAATRKRLRDEKGADFADEIMVTLHQHRVLVEP